MAQTRSFKKSSAALEDNQELALILRNDFIESVQDGSAIVIGPDSKSLIEIGNPHDPIYPRSALKPFQAIGALQSGASLKGEKVAISCGSHTGDFSHLDTVYKILTDAELDPSYLQCPPRYPEDSTSSAWFIRNEKDKTALANPCSGKHAAFLNACVNNDWELETYLSLHHPLQKNIITVVEEYTQAPVEHIGIDGCGAPIPAVALSGLAKAYSRLATSIGNLDENARAVTVGTAMIDYPEMIQGPQKQDTVISEDLGILAKFGADGVMALAVPDGTTVVVKIKSGSNRTSAAVALLLLGLTEKVSPKKIEQTMTKVVQPVMGGTQEVGNIHVGVSLTDLFAQKPSLEKIFSHWI